MSICTILQTIQQTLWILWYKCKPCIRYSKQFQNCWLTRTLNQFQYCLEHTQLK